MLRCILVNGVTVTADNTKTRSDVKEVVFCALVTTVKVGLDSGIAACPPYRGLLDKVPRKHTRYSTGCNEMLLCEKCMKNVKTQVPILDDTGREHNCTFRKSAVLYNCTPVRADLTQEVIYICL